MTEHSDELLALVPLVELKSVDFLDLTARRELDVSPLEDGRVSVEPSYTLGTMVASGGGSFLLRLRVDFSSEVGNFAAEAAAEYIVTAPESVELNEALLTEFANEVGIMVLLPYLRQAIADLTQRVFGQALLMPQMQRGHLTFAIQGSDSSP